MYEDAKACAAAMRDAMEAAGINARCRVLKGSRTAIQVFPVAYGLQFPEPTQRTIRAMAIERRLTLVRGLPIDVERMTDPHGMEFHLPHPTTSRPRADDGRNAAAGTNRR